MTTGHGRHLVIDEDDQALAAILEHAELPSLLPALAYVTGDMSLVADDLRPPPVLSAAVLPQAGMSEETQKRARQRCLRALGRFRDGGCHAAAPPGTRRCAS